MAKEIKLPKLSQTMEKGTVVNFLVNIGEEIKRGQVVFEIKTENATIKMESPMDGFVKNILVNIGQTLPVGNPMMIVGAKDEQVSQGFIDCLLKGAITDFAGQTQTISGECARDVAVKQGKPVIAQAAGPQAGSETQQSKMRRAIGLSLQRSWQQSPHFNVAMTINMKRAMNFRDHFNRNRPKPQQLSVNDLVIKACAQALLQYPALNSTLTDDKIIYHSNINIGVAAAVADGLVVPVLTDADKRSWDEIQSQTKILVAEARNRKIIGAGKGTFTVTNLGMFGVDYFTAIINPPECAILAVGAVMDKAVVINKIVTAVPMMQVVLCSDHRIIDGVLAAQFLKSLKEYLEEKIE
jgi:pyruvate dehydrogenase E2 component (dihydrolipoamide acetyltransferase)